MCPIFLCQSQFSFSFTKKQPLTTSCNVYMSFGVLVVVAINWLYFSLLISHFFELKRKICPWSHILLTLQQNIIHIFDEKHILCCSILTSKLYCVCSIKIAYPSFVKYTNPPLHSFGDMKLFMSPFICVQKPLSTYHTFFFLWAFRASVNLSVLFI